MARRKKEKRKKILLVDDNHETLEIISYLLKLQDNRIDVLDAPSAEEGMLELSSIDLLVTDLRLPGMGGMDLIKRARRRNKELPAIVLSGLNETDAKKLIGDVEIVKFVPKPYRPDELINLILKTVWGDDAPPPLAPVPVGMTAEPAQFDIPAPRAEVVHPPLSAGVISRLKELQSRTFAHQVILWGLDGTLLYVFDEKARDEANKLGKLAVSSVANGLELLARSGSTPTRYIAVLDGDPYEIVLAHVKSKTDYCLAIILNGGGKLGTVWGAMQRTVADIAVRLHPDPNRPTEKNKLQEVVEKKASKPIAVPKPVIPIKPITPITPEVPIKLNPITSDAELENLLQAFSTEEISDDELDSFWDVTTPASFETNTEATPKVATETTTETVAETPSEPAPPEIAVEFDPIASDTELEDLLAGFAAEEISDDELDNFWEVGGSSSKAPVSEPALEETQELKINSSTELLQDGVDAAQITPEPEPTPAKASEKSRLEGILVDTSDELDDHWEEMKGLLGLEDEPDQSEDQLGEAEPQTLAKKEKANDADAANDGMMSYEEAKARGILGN